MIQLIVYGVLALGLLGGFIALVHSHDSKVTAAYQAKLDAKDAEIAEHVAKAKQEADNHISDMESAFEAGEANAKTVTQTIYVKGQANVASDKGLADPQCRMSDVSLQLLRGALAGMRSASDTGELATALPGPRAPDGGDVQRAVPQQPQEHGAVGGVHPPAGEAGGSHQVPGTVVPAHPKPVPIGK